MDVQRNPNPRRTTRRQWLAAAGAAALAGAAASGCSAGATEPLQSTRPSTALQLRLLGSSTLPYRLDFKDTDVGGLSGLDYDPVQDLWYAISDAGNARFYTLRLALSPAGLGEPQLLDVVEMKQADGKPYPRRGPGRLLADPEAIRFRPATRTLLWTSEGDTRRGVDPFVREMTTDGRHLRELRLPANFAADPNGETGPRYNGALEGLALTPDGRGAWAAMEHPLLQDGPAADPRDPGAPCRFTLFDLQSGRPLRQIAYRPERIRRIPIPGFAFADNGVSEILMLDAHRMLVLERGFSVGVGVTLRLFVIDVREPTDTLGLSSLRGADIAVAQKTLVADFDRLGLPRLDNTEGICWGPRLPGQGGAAGQGERTLVVVSDDNFNPLQVTQFAAFAFSEPIPS